MPAMGMRPKKVIRAHWAKREVRSPESKLINTKATGNLCNANPNSNGQSREAMSAWWWW